MSDQRFFMLETLGDSDDPDACVLHKFVDGLNRHAYSAHIGKPLAPVWTANARIYVDPDQDALKLESLIGNTRNMLVVSTQFRRLIEEHCVGVPIECLPVAIFDPRERLLSDDYHLINPLGAFDCLDMQKSEVTWSKETPGELISIDGHVLDRTKVSRAPQLFRMHLDPTSYVVGKRLGRAMLDANLTNIVWAKLKFGDELG